MFTAKHFWHYCHPSHPAKIWAIVETKPHNLPDPSPYSQQPPTHPKTNPPPFDLTNPPKQPLPWNLVQQAFSQIGLSKRRGIVVWDRTSQLLGFTVQGHTVSRILIQLAGTSSSVWLVIPLNKSCQSTQMLISLLQLVDESNVIRECTLDSIFQRKARDKNDK